MTIAPRNTMSRACLLLGAMILAAAPVAAIAQAPARSATPATRTGAPAPQPDRTTAQYGDWTLRCETTGNASERTCDVLLTIADQRRQPIAQLVMRPGQQAATLVVSAQVATNATVSEPARLMLEESAIATLPFQRCQPQGCFAEAQQSEADIAAAVGRAEAARLEYKNAEGALLVLQMPLRGLAAALQALKVAERR